MGQAKLRGNRDQRVALVKERAEAMRPENLVCGSCQAEVHEFQSMDVRQIDGMEAAYAGICPQCKDAVWAFRGDPDVIASFVETLSEKVGGGTLGAQTKGGMPAALPDK